MIIYLLIAMEILLRISNKATDPLIEQVISGSFLYKPGQKGKWIRGSDAEIKSEFNINSAGWNSSKEYFFGENKKYIALIGDSYIEGLHVPPDSSIGRKIEVLRHDVTVHEYGRSGAGSEDYKDLYWKYCAGRYDKIFIIMKDEDLFDTSHSVITSRGNNVTNSFIRKLYYMSSFLRFINIQLGFLKSLQDIFCEKKGEPSSSHDKYYEGNHLVDIKLDRRSYFEDFPKNVFFLYEKDRLLTFYSNYLGTRGVEIKHSSKLIDFGFDPHWNNEARWDVAKAIANQLN